MLKKALFAISLCSLAWSAAGCRQEAATASAAGASAEREAAAIRIVTPQEVAALQKSTPDLVVVDANPRRVYDEGHVPGARWGDEDLKEVMPTSRDTQVVFYCYNEACMASHGAAKEALAQGFTKVARMSAGISGWKAAGLPVEK